MNYYHLHDKNSAYPDRWFLGSPITEAGEELDARIFLDARVLHDIGRLRLPITQEGAHQDFTMAEWEMPVLENSFAEELLSVAPNDVQLIPIAIEGEQHPFSVLNVLHRIRCLDESRSTITWWPANAAIADLAGTYLTVSDIHIDPTRVGASQMFRIDGWVSALIVSEPVGAILADATGAVLERVYP